VKATNWRTASAVETSQKAPGCLPARAADLVADRRRHAELRAAIARLKASAAYEYGLEGVVAADTC